MKALPIEKKHRKRTGKPCSGCGESYHKAYRYVDEVCGNCKELIKQGKEYQRYLEKLKTGEADNVIIAYPDNDWDLLQLPHMPAYENIDIELKEQLPSASSETSFSDRLDDRIREYLINFLDSVSEPIVKNHNYDLRNSESLSDLPYYSQPSKKFRIFKKESIPYMKAFIKLIPIVMKRVYKQGFSDGSDLLNRLATGEAGVAEFDSVKEKVLDKE